MTKNDTKKLLNKIKGYYNSQLFVDEYVIDAWSDSMKPYDLDDAVEHIQIYVKENPDVAPKPQTFIRGLTTNEEKMMLRNSDFTVECNLCHKWMPLEQYDSHYENCLDIQYLASVAKERGETFAREDLEQCKREVINKLMCKYPPNVTWNYKGGIE